MNNTNTVIAFSNGNYRAHNSTGSIYASDNILYSYGSHFPMAINMGDYYLINGDRYSNTTAKHQSLCLQYLTPNIQIPFSALNSAYITPSKITLIENKKDTYIPQEYTDKNGETKTREVHYLGGVLFEYNDIQYISAFDSQESLARRSYFLTRLNDKHNTFDEAIESLKPKQVKTAIENNIDVKRQGEWFFIPTEQKTRNLTKIGKMYPIYPDSTHIASEVSEKNGTRYVRGTIRHKPPYRNSQHAMLSLGKTWYIPVKNTAIESYEASGLVD
jgi:hypothetical protein